MSTVDNTDHIAPTHRVLVEVADERAAQDRKWGEQNHPDGTGSDRARVYADALQRICDRADAEGTVTWAAILLEEIAEAMAERPGSPNLRTELVQIAAVATQWVESIDRRAHAATRADAPIRLQWGPGRGLTGVRR